MAMAFMTPPTHANDMSLMTIICESFGHKYGDIEDAELVFDVRCFPNPFYRPDLRDGTGLDADVSAYVFSHEETKAFVVKVEELLAFLLPLYEKDGRSAISIAFGCTGGQHRSVAIAEEIAARLRQDGFHVVTRHRDVAKKSQ